MIYNLMGSLYNMILLKFFLAPAASGFLVSDTKSTIQTILRI